MTPEAGVGQEYPYEVEIRAELDDSDHRGTEHEFDEKYETIQKLEVDLIIQSTPENPTEAISDVTTRGDEGESEIIEPTQLHAHCFERASHVDERQNGEKFHRANQDEGLVTHRLADAQLPLK